MYGLPFRCNLAMASQSIILSQKQLNYITLNDQYIQYYDELTQYVKSRRYGKVMRDMCNNEILASHSFPLCNHILKA